MHLKLSKKLKVFVSSILLCLLTISSTAFATTNVNINEKADIDSTMIEGANYTYENAPELVRLEHEENCKSIGIEPKNDTPIFVPSSAFEKYGISVSDNNLADTTQSPRWMTDWKDGHDITYNNDFKENTMYVYQRNPYRSYTVSKSTLVGYNHVSKGDPVRLLQLLLNRAAKSGKANSVIVDGIFGRASHSSLIKFQKANGLSVDAIAGRNTWTKFRAYLDIHHNR